MQQSPLGCERGTDCCGGAGLRQEQLSVCGHEFVGDGVPCMCEMPQIILSQPFYDMHSHTKGQLLAI